MKQIIIVTILAFSVCHSRFEQNHLSSKACTSCAATRVKVRCRSRLEAAVICGETSYCKWVNKKSDYFELCIDDTHATIPGKLFIIVSNPCSI